MHHKITHHHYSLVLALEPQNHIYKWNERGQDGKETDKRGYLTIHVDERNYRTCEVHLLCTEYTRKHDGGSSNVQRQRKNDKSYSNSVNCAYK